MTGGVLMDFSQYVLEAIASIDYLEKDRDYQAESLIRGAAEKAENANDSHILGVIAGSMSMKYKSKEQVFLPLFIEYGVGRSFAPEDLSEADLDILRCLTKVTKSSWLRTRFAHIIWTIKKEHPFGQLAVAGYLDAFQKTCDPVHWTTCYEKIKAAYQIASAMGKSAEAFKQTRSVIQQKLTEMNGTDTFFLSLRLLKLVQKDLTKEELPKYAGIAEILFHKNTNPSNDNTHLADEAFATLEPIYKRMNRDADIKAAKEQYAGYYAAQAKKLANKNDYFRAIHLMKNACALYTGVNREKAIELRLEMEPWQKLALKDLHPITTKIDVKETADALDEMFDGLTLPEAIVQFGRVARIYKVDEVKQQILAEQDEQFFSSMFGSSLLNDQGQSVQELPPISDVEEDSDAFRKHMVRHVAERRRMFDSIPVRFAFQHLRKHGPISEDALDFLVQDNAIIPDNRAEIIREGLCLALNGRLYSAIHILQPQTEHIFRHLVKMCGDTVTFLKEDGHEEYKPLSALFKSEKLLECYDENVIFTFQSIMDEPAGENLRNLNGHGLLEPVEGNSVASLFFVSLLIKLLSIYGNQAREIRMKLAKKSEKA